MRLLMPLLVLITVLVISLEIDRTPRDADLIIANATDSYTLDPQRMSYLHDFRVAGALYEGLVTWNPVDFSIVPAAASSWNVSDDGRMYTFVIDERAQWSNGADVTADDFSYSFLRLLLPDTAADYSGLMFVIDGARDFFMWRQDALQQFSEGDDAHDLWVRTEQSFAEMVGVEVLDERTVRITLTRPTPYFLDLLAFAVCSPVYRPCVEGWPAAWDDAEPPPFESRRWFNLDEASGRVQQLHGWTRPAFHIGNGPYSLDQWRYKRDLRLVRNATFREPERARVDSIAIVTIEDANTRVLAYETGAVDVLMSVDVPYEADMLEQVARYRSQHADELDALQQQNDLTVDAALASCAEPGPDQRRDLHVFPTFGTEFMNFNCRPLLDSGKANPFADARVRRAFVMATDRERLVRDITRLGEPVATTIIPPGSLAGYESPTGLGTNVDLARVALADAGWIDRDGDGVLENEEGEAFPTVQMLWRTSQVRTRWIALELRRQWQETLGVDVVLQGFDSKLFKEKLRQGQFMTAPGRWYGDYGDPSTFLELFRSTDGNNDRGFSNAAIDALLEDASKEPDAARRMKIFQECEARLFQDELPLIPLCGLVQTYMYDPTRVRGMTRHPRLVHMLWRLDVLDGEPNADDEWDVDP